MQVDRRIIFGINVNYGLFYKIGNLWSN